MVVAIDSMILERSATDNHQQPRLMQLEHSTLLVCIRITVAPAQTDQLDFGNSLVRCVAQLVQVVVYLTACRPQEMQRQCELLSSVMIPLHWKKSHDCRHRWPSGWRGGRFVAAWQRGYGLALFRAER